MGKPLIFIAEDDINLAEILKTKLLLLNFDVIVAHDGEAAEKIILEKKPDISLLDIMMPKKNGLEVLESVMKQSNMKDAPIFMLSNLGQQDDINRATAAGAKDYIIKANHSLAQIVEKVENYLKTHPPVERLETPLALPAKEALPLPPPPVSPPPQTAAIAQTPAVPQVSIAPLPVSPMPVAMASMPPPLPLPPVPPLFPSATPPPLPPVSSQWRLIYIMPSVGQPGMYGYFFPLS